jgi:hypothetical protein
MFSKTLRPPGMAKQQVRQAFRDGRRVGLADRRFCKARRAGRSSGIFRPAVLPAPLA